VSVKSWAELGREPLVRLVGGPMKPHDLTFALEALGGLRPLSKEASDCLLRASMHESPIVREGAVYGMAHYVGDEDVAKRLAEMAQNDRHPSIQEAAAEALER
jgi:hypothetical protein